MSDTKQREIAETVFERNQRREKEINDALKQEDARREAAVKNTYRLRALRIARDAKSNNGTQKL
jgi:phosphopantothenate synthetase